MGYYRGDYYRGDYYRGDPGILSGIGKFLGGAVKTVAGGLGGFIQAGPLGAIAGAAKGAGLIPVRAIAPPVPSGGMGPMLPALPPIGVGQVGPFASQTGGLIQVQTYTAGGKPVYKTYDPKTGKLVKKRRRMNVTNVRALRRAIRRSRGFIKIARKTVGVFGLSVQRRGARKRIAARR